MIGRAPAPAELVVGTGQTVQVHHAGRIRASAIRTGSGWTATVDGRTHDVATLDELLAVLGILPDHHRRVR